MRKLIYGMNRSLDGYIAAPGDDLGWSRPSDELFQWWLEQELAIGLSLYGRKLWETMSSYWPTGDQQPGATPAQIEFARNWRDTPKVVFSRAIDKVDWNTRLVTGDAVAEITRLKAGDGEPMRIGGATLAGAAMRAGLIDGYEMVDPSGAGGRRHAVLHRAGWLGEPEPGGDADVSRRRGPDQVRDEALKVIPLRLASREWQHAPGARSGAGEGAEAPARGAGAKPDAIMTIPVQQRRLFLEAETGSQSITTAHPDKTGAGLSKLERYRSYLRTAPTTGTRAGIDRRLPDPISHGVEVVEASRRRPAPPLDIARIACASLARVALAQAQPLSRQGLFAPGTWTRPAVAARRPRWAAPVATFRAPFPLLGGEPGRAGVAPGGRRALRCLARRAPGGRARPATRRPLGLVSLW